MDYFEKILNSASSAKRSTEDLESKRQVLARQICTDLVNQITRAIGGALIKRGFHLREEASCTFFGSRTIVIRSPKSRLDYRFYIYVDHPNHCSTDYFNKLAYGYDEHEYKIDFGNSSGFGRELTFRRKRGDSLHLAEGELNKIMETLVLYIV